MKLVYIPFYIFGLLLCFMITPTWAEEANLEADLYTCPMHTHITSDEAGTCPICGMELTQTKQQPDAPKKGGVSINATTLQTMNVQTTHAHKKPLGRTVHGYGKLTQNMANRHTLSARADGWIKTMDIHSEGEKVKQGDFLFNLYSPEMLAAQKDFLSASSQAHQQATRQRLRALGMQAKAINALSEKGKAFVNVPFYAPINGYVTAIHAHNGAAVESGAPLMVLDNFSTLWVDVGVNTSDIVHLNDSTRATLHLVDTGEDVPAKIKLIHPNLDDTTRTGKIRLLVENPNGTLKPGQYADVTLQTNVRKRLAVPETALLHSKQGYKVIVAAGEGQFYPQPVKIGVRGDGMVEITGGLDAQTKVVTNGQFLIDADSNLNNAGANMGANMSEGGDNGKE